jgi:hypothetical protein
MESFAFHHHLSIADTDLTGHVFFKVLNGRQIGWKSVPKVPGTKIHKKVQFIILNASVDGSQTGGIQ